MASDVRITNAEKAGKFIIGVADGSITLEADIALLKQQLLSNGINANDFADIKFPRDTDELLNIKVPSIAAIKETLDAIRSNPDRRYNWPNADVALHYFRDLSGTGRPDGEMLFGLRIADYTCHTCM